MKRTAALLLALMMLLSLVACGSQPEAPAEEPKVEATMGNEGLNQEVVVGTEPNVKYVEHMIMAIDTMPTTFDPGSNTAPVLNCLVWNELIGYNKLTKELEPELATEWNWVGDDCKVLHLELRQGVKFQNGNDFTAADVEYTLSTCANTNIASYYDHCDIKNDYSVDVYLSNANADFISILTNTLYAGVKDKESCEADPDNGSAIGTGPWALDLANTIPGDTIELVRNDNYYGELPAAKQLTLRYIKSAASRLIALQNGEAHAMMSCGETDVPTIKADPNLEYCSGAGVGPAKMYYIGFNMKNGAAKDNIYLRQAVACVMNNADIILAAGDANGVESDGAFWGYDTPYRVDTAKFQEDLSYNVERAKELVEKAKELAGGTLPTLRLTGNTSKAINMNMCLVVQDACRQVGIEVVIEESDSAGVLAKTNPENPDFDMIQYNVPLESWASAANRMFTTGSSNNRAILSDPWVEDLLVEAAATKDDAKRADLYGQLQVYIHDNAIYIPSYYGSRDGAQVAGVEGIIWTNDGYPEFAYARMAE